MSDAAQDEAADAGSPRYGKKVRTEATGPDAPAIIGFVDVADDTVIEGWACNRETPSVPTPLVLSLGGIPIAFETTFRSRSDLEETLGKGANACFRFDLSSDETRTGVMEAVLRLTEGPDGATFDLDRHATLGLWPVSDPEIDPERFEPECHLPLPDTLKTDRSLADWLKAFDIDDVELEVRRAQSEGVHTVGLTPVPEETSPGQPKVIAFYLPQYYPTAENDEWWGPGYTEWASVATSKENYPGHVTPNIPADFGFYDLRVRDVRQKQGQLAKDYGIYGFCYYFYWFSGRRILEEPTEMMLGEGEPDLPFCLCWANETWSRRWDGSEQEVLLKQEHDVKTDVGILDDLMPYFDDPRYIRIDGKPLLVIYRPGIMKDVKGFVRELRRAAVKSGLPGLHLCNATTFGETDMTSFGFDASVGFPPHNVEADTIEPSLVSAPANFGGRIIDYKDLVGRQISAPYPEYPHYPGVMPRWDNSSRRPMQGHIFHGSSPNLFEVWLRNAAEQTLQKNPDAPLLFINSWNEWSEGAHLEPDRRYGRGYLEAVRRIASGDISYLASVDDYASDEHLPAPRSELEEVNRRLLIENSLLSHRLQQGRLLAKPFMVASGRAEPAAKMSTESDDGFCNIDSVNQRPATSKTTVRSQTPLTLQGWMFGSREKGGGHGDFGYVVFKRHADGLLYHAPVAERFLRPDVCDYYALPTERGFVGFDFRLDISPMESGIYGLTFLDVKDGLCFAIGANIRLEILR